MVKFRNYPGAQCVRWEFTLNKIPHNIQIQTFCISAFADMFLVDWRKPKNPGKPQTVTGRTGT